ncbi:MAG: hypothetical protein H0V66_14185, partial [Bdellovibrionales bacterium]|nr:hypothetical protein [Bdellovibrionales bacterium]
MKKFFIVLTVLLSFLAQANEAEKCFSDSVELAIAYKINALAEGDCSNLDKEKFKTIEETRQNKRKFYRAGVK